jgi:RNase P/RNase MRP subunit p29
MNLKILIPLFALLVIYTKTNGQITIQFNAINEYAFKTREALNFTAINPGTKSFEVEFRGKISSGDGQTVVEFKTNPAMINPGANMVSPVTVSLREQLYYNNDIAEIEGKTGTYPSGNYTICIWSACIVQDCNGAGQTTGSVETPECIRIHVENPTPLLLAYPENDSEIEETRPMFTWIPPAPVAGSASLNYTMTLVEVLEGQNKSDALTMNRPLVDMQGVANPMLMYPSDLPALEAGKTYAWQVEAFVGRTSIAKSEQWKFKIKKDTLDLKKIPKDQSYVEIAGQTGSSLFYAVGQLKLRHVVRLENGKINYTISDKSGKVIKTDQGQLQINPGDNRFILDLEKELKFKHGETYTMSGKLLNGEVFIITFMYINPTLIKND